jgi:RHS repeat-associated protein
LSTNGDQLFDSSAAADSLRAGLTTRLTTENDGDLSNEQRHYPYGESLQEAGTALRLRSGQANASVERKFTTYLKEWETESTGGKLNYAVFREQSARTGRFLMPDPVRGNVRNPQRLNRYAYVSNNPASLIDPRGLDPSGPQPLPYEHDKDVFGIMEEAIQAGVPGWIDGRPVNQTPRSGEPMRGPWGGVILGGPGFGYCGSSDAIPTLAFTEGVGLPLPTFPSLGCGNPTAGCKATWRREPLLESMCEKGDIFVMEYECTGDSDCCRKEKRTFIDWCEDYGKNPKNNLEYTRIIGHNWVSNIHCCGVPKKKKLVFRGF